MTRTNGAPSSIEVAALKRQTDQLQAEVAEHEEIFRLLVASVRDYAIFILDPHGHIATWNLGAARIKGYEAKEIIGKHFSVFYPENDVRDGKCERELVEAEREGRFEDEGWRIRKDGTRFWASVIITAMRNDEGRLVGFAKVTRDLTERKRAEEAQAARLAAEETNRIKDAFLAMVGHELRNPLAPIVTALQLMRLRANHRISKEQQIIERQVKLMMRLVDDLLDVSRITRGKIELRKKHIDVRDLVARAIETVSPLLEQRQHSLEVDVPERAIFVNADDIRIIQVFTNLLTNAARYTDPGGHIGVTVAVSGRDATVEVRDDGLGITPELLPTVFDLFVQGHQGVERATGGLGLGLTLVKRLVEMHGGQVEARSPGPGEGSTFVVRLPVLQSVALPTMAESARRLAKPTHGPSLRILVVDDNVDALTLVTEALRAAGHVVAAATGASDAIEAARRLRPEVAILDLGLPVLDGYDLASRLRAVLAPATPRFIALTGYGQPHDRERTRVAGFSAHLVKPVDLRELLASLDSGAATFGGEAG